MPALKDAKLEAFTRCLLRNTIKCWTKSKAATEAAKEAGYSGSSLAANARKRANRADVKARMVELASELATPEQKQERAALAVDLAAAEQRLSEIIMAQVVLDETVMPKDIVSAIKQLADIKGWNAPKKSQVDIPQLYDLSKLTDEQVVSLAAIISTAAETSVAGDDSGGTDSPQAQAKPH